MLRTVGRMRNKDICALLDMKPSAVYNIIFGPLTPSIDHVIALKNGGNHVWSNVQLAHAICNIIKNDNDLTEEVITHAKEQAIAYKCA